MYTRFYDDTVVTRFIKGFLANTNIPLTSVVSKGDRLACGNVYISKDGNIVRAAESSNQLEFFTKDYSIIDNYIYNKEYKSLTSTYISNISGYDSTTHRWLGEFLRFYRDYFGIDMMPFYNCFGNDYIDNVNFNSSSIFTGSSENTKLLIVPIKYNTTYYVAIDSTAPIEIQQGFYGPKGLMNELNSVLDSVENVFTDLFENTSEAINVEGKKHDIERHLQSMNFILNKYFRKDNELSDVSGDTIKNIMTSILIQTIRKTYLSDLVSDWITTKEASIISGLTPRQIRSIFIEDDLVLAKKEHNTWYIQLESFIYQYMVWCKGEIDD